MKGLTKDKIVKQIKKIIKQSYDFLGYIEFANKINSFVKKAKLLESDSEKEKKRKIKAINKEFSDRLLVIDEVHNIRAKDISRRTTKNLLDLVTYAENMKILLLTATPMFNDAREIMGVVTQHDGLDTGLTVYQNLFLYGFLIGLSKSRAQKRTHEVLEFFNLRDRSGANVYELSGGMKRRLAIARSMMSNPTVIVLDEPSTGLDPQSRNRVWEELAILKESGVTVLLSTHYMEEAAILCDRLSIMDRGKILDEGTPDQMILRHAPKEVAQVRVAPGSLRRVRDYLNKHEISFREVGALLSVTGTEGVTPDLSGLDGVAGVRTSYRVGNLEDKIVRVACGGLLRLLRRGLLL